jgi:hypothetical protein
VSVGTHGESRREGRVSMLNVDTNVVVLPSIVVVEISLQLHRSFFQWL